MVQFFETKFFSLNVKFRSNDKHPYVLSISKL